MTGDLQPGPRGATGQAARRLSHLHYQTNAHLCAWRLRWLAGGHRQPWSYARPRRLSGPTRPDADRWRRLPDTRGHRRRGRVAAALSAARSVVLVQSAVLAERQSPAGAGTVTPGRWAWASAWKRRSPRWTTRLPSPGGVSRSRAPMQPKTRLRSGQRFSRRQQTWPTPKGLSN